MERNVLTRREFLSGLGVIGTSVVVSPFDSFVMTQNDRENDLALIRTLTEVKAERRAAGGIKDDAAEWREEDYESLRYAYHTVRPKTYDEPVFVHACDSRQYASCSFDVHCALERAKIDRQRKR